MSARREGAGVCSCSAPLRGETERALPLPALAGLAAGCSDCFDGESSASLPEPELEPCPSSPPCWRERMGDWFVRSLSPRKPWRPRAGVAPCLASDSKMRLPSGEEERCVSSMLWQRGCAALYEREQMLPRRASLSQEEKLTANLALAELGAALGHGAACAARRRHAAAAAGGGAGRVYGCEHGVRRRRGGARAKTEQCAGRGRRQRAGVRRKAEWRGMGSKEKGRSSSCS
jgi:hypothetical protein